MRRIDMIHSIAGAFILISVSLAYLHSLWWMLFTFFVGANLFQYGFTRFCPLEILLRKMGIGTKM